MSPDVATFGLEPYWFIIFPVVLWVLASIFIALRVYVRVWMIRAPGIDDYVLLAAYILFTTSCVIYVVFGLQQINEGIVGDVLSISRLALILILLYLGESIVLKIALALFFHRILVQPIPIWIIRISTLIYVMYAVAFFFTALFQCGHPSTFNYLAGNCISWDIFGPMNYVAAILNAVIDWILTITPMAAVWKLQMTRGKKISVSLIMMVGSIASVASIARIPFVSTLHIHGNLDFFRLTIPICILSIAETALGIMAISGAALKPLFKSILEKSSYGGSKRGYGTSKPSAFKSGTMGRSSHALKSGDHDRKIYATTSIAMVIDDRREEDEMELTAMDRS